MRQSTSLLALIVLVLPIGLFAFSAPAAASTIYHHRHHAHHRAVSHRIMHHSKHATWHRHTHLKAG